MAPITKKTKTVQILATLFSSTALLLGCGRIELTATRGSQPSKEENPGAMAAFKETASLELTVPQTPYANANSLDLTLTQKVGNDALRLVHAARYPTSQTSIKIDQLPPGSYRINLKLWDPKTGKIHATGGGDTLVQKEQTARAQIVMTPVSSGTGSLEISVVYPHNKPIACTNESRLPSCIKFGTDYKVQTFEKNAQCEWVPKNVEVVNSKFCAGLPGAENIP